MQQLSIFLIAAMFFTSCGGHSGKTGNQDDVIPGEGTSHEKTTEQQEKAIKDKYFKIGMEVATQTQAELLKVVRSAMASGGPVHAVDYCNIEALELKDSLSVLNNCRIQRLSVKYRNPADKPRTETEMGQLKSYESLHSEGKALTPSVYIVGDEVEFYQPIFINSGACLLCHGDPETQIAGETMNIIKKLYPNDLATGYAMNDFRGVWKITFLH